MSRIAKTLLFPLAALISATTTPAATLYWTDFGANATGGISRADTHTFEIETVIPDGLSTPYRIAIDALGGKMYWTGYALGGGVQRANLDGSELETLVPTCMALGIAVDGPGGKLYWNTSGDVWRANLDGSDIEWLFTADEPSFIQDLALDLLNEKIYFSNWSAWPGSYGRLQRANLDGTDIEDVRPEIRNGPLGIGVDPIGGKVYWAKNHEDAGTGRVLRADLDGANPETVLSEIDPDSLTLDLVAGQVYWTDLDDFFELFGTVQRVNFDGSGHETLPFGERYIGGIAILHDTEIPCPGDLDGDNDVDIADLAQLLGHYGLTEGAAYEDGDLDGDGDVDISDLAGLLGVYGTVCE